MKKLKTVPALEIPGSVAHHVSLGRLRNGVGGGEEQGKEGGEEGLAARRSELSQAHALESRDHLLDGEAGRRPAAVEECERLVSLAAGLGEDEPRGRIGFQPSTLTQSAQDRRPGAPGEPGERIVQIARGEDGTLTFRQPLKNGNSSHEIAVRAASQSPQQGTEGRNLSTLRCFRSGSRAPNLCFVAHRRDRL